MLLCEKENPSLLILPPLENQQLKFYVVTFISCYEVRRIDKKLKKEAIHNS